MKVTIISNDIKLTGVLIKCTAIIKVSFNNKGWMKIINCYSAHEKKMKTIEKKRKLKFPENEGLFLMNK